MASNLIYLHIPKTAGTSFRELLLDNYPFQDVYWHKITKDSARELSSYKVIGGHRRYTFYKKIKSRKLFLGIVRDPVSRAVSLYNYHCRTDLPGYLTWIKNGFDPDCMLNTIENCNSFRAGISNVQCHFLSDGKTFESVMDVLAKDEFIIGTQEHIDGFVGFLATSLGWREHTLARANVGKPGYAANRLNDTKLVDLIREINQQDIKLYEYIKSHKLLLSYNESLPLTDFAPEHAPNLPFHSARSKIGLSFAQQDQIIRLRKNESIKLPFLIHNQSDSMIPCAGDYPVKIAYHWYCENNATYEWDGLRTSLPENIPAQHCATVTATIKAPERAGQFTLAVGLLLERIAWFESSNANHPVIIHADVTE